MKKNHKRIAAIVGTVLAILLALNLASFLSGELGYKVAVPIEKTTSDGECIKEIWKIPVSYVDEHGDGWAAFPHYKEDHPNAEPARTESCITYTSN